MVSIGGEQINSLKVGLQLRELCVSSVHHVVCEDVGDALAGFRLSPVGIVIAGRSSLSPLECERVVSGFGFAIWEEEAVESTLGKVFFPEKSRVRAQRVFDQFGGWEAMTQHVSLWIVSAKLHSTSFLSVL